MKWIKTITSGIAASFTMFVFIFVGIYIIGIAPFNSPPSAAFLYNLGLETAPLPLVLHFLYGTFWAYVLIYVLEEDVTIPKTLLMALALWFFMMFVYSPLIGWGIFGLGNAHLLNTDHPLYLEPGPKYIIATLLLHVIYGLVLGWLGSRWVIKPKVETQ